MGFATVLAFVFLTTVGSQTASPVTAPPPTLPELREELLRRQAADQKARNSYIEFMKAHGPGGRITQTDLTAELQKRFREVSESMTRIDRENTQWLIEAVGRHGWPTYAMVGRDGGDAAWLLVQHADANPKFQRRALDLMTGLPADQVSRPNVAYLTDRVLIAEGKKQRYGTQFTSMGGKLTPRPIEDPENVDARRREMGLSTMAEYVKQLQRVYGIEP